GVHVDDPRADSSPNFHVDLRAAGERYDASINVLSASTPSEVKYVRVDPFVHPLTERLAALAWGFTPLPRRGGTSDPRSLDFVRGRLFDPSAMRPLAAAAPGPNNDLQDLLSAQVASARQQAGAEVFVWGGRWN